MFSSENFNMNKWPIAQFVDFYAHDICLIL
jgi:hypothetical protein